MPILVKDPLYKSIRIGPFVEHAFKIANLEYKEFPDKETYVRILDDVKDEDCIVLARGYPEQDRNIVRTILILKTLKELGARKIVLCIPYLPYSRQDKRFLPGEAISAKIIVDTFLANGADIILTVDVHNNKAFVPLGKQFINITTEDLWAKFISKNYKSTELTIIAPDIGRKDFVESIAKKCGANFVVFSKTRDLKTGKIIRHEPLGEREYKVGIQRSEVIFIIDDILATGGTVASLVSKLRRDGYNNKVVCLFSHGLFLGNSYDKLINAGVDEIYCTDSVENPFIHHDLIVAPYILQKLNDIMIF